MVDIEAAVIAWITSNFEFHAYDSPPEDRAFAFATVERTGGPRENPGVDHPMVAIQTWATDKGTAYDMAAAIDSKMQDLKTVPGISGASRNSLYYFPDSDKTPRYQIVADITTTE
jgi:hypothetical protein